MAEDLDTFEETYAMAKLPPRLTGLPMAVWIMHNEGIPHDFEVKVSRIRGGRARQADLNQAVIADYWDGSIDIDEVLQHLARLP